MKRSILIFLSLSKIFFKVLMSVASMVSCFRLFHLLTTRSEKTCFLKSVLHLFFLIFAVWPLVRLFESSWKNVSNLWCYRNMYIVVIIVLSASHDAPNLSMIVSVSIKGEMSRLSWPVRLVNIPRWFNTLQMVIHLSTNWAWVRLTQATTLIETNVLLLFLF